MIVLKLGGAALKHSLENPDFFKVFKKSSQPVVIVHGGGPMINKLSEALKIEVKFVEGQRVTSSEQMSVVEMALTGDMNSKIVRSLKKSGLSAWGLSGAQTSLLKCDLEDPKLGLVGRVREVDVSVLRILMDKGYLPVIAPVGLLADFQSCNVNADLAASAIAASLKADTLIFLTDQDGILDAGGAAMKSLTQEQLEELYQSKVVSGGMKVKARAILEFLKSGAGSKVYVMNGKEPAPIEQALHGKFSGTSVT